MTQPMNFIDCRGLSAPLTVLRIKQAAIGRSDCGLPLDVLVDRTICDADRISTCLTGESIDVRLVYFSGYETAGEIQKAATKGTARHV